MSQYENPEPTISTEVLGSAVAAFLLVEANQGKHGVRILRDRYRAWLKLLAKLKFATTIEAAGEQVAAVGDLYSGLLAAAAEELSNRCSHTEGQSVEEDGEALRAFISWAIWHFAATRDEAMELVLGSHRRQADCEAPH